MSIKFYVKELKSGEKPVGVYQRKRRPPSYPSPALFTRQSIDSDGLQNNRFGFIPYRSLPPNKIKHLHDIDKLLMIPSILTV